VDELQCPICSGDDKFCKEYGCGAGEGKAVTIKDLEKLFLGEKYCKPKGYASFLMVSQMEFLFFKDHLVEKDGKDFYPHPTFGLIEIIKSKPA